MLSLQQLSLLQCLLYQLKVFLWFKGFKGELACEKKFLYFYVFFLLVLGHACNSSGFYPLWCDNVADKNIEIHKSVITVSQRTYHLNCNSTKHFVLKIMICTLTDKTRSFTVWRHIGKTKTWLSQKRLEQLTWFFLKFIIS